MILGNKITIYLNEEPIDFDFYMFIQLCNIAQRRYPKSKLKEALENCFYEMTAYFVAKEQKSFKTYKNPEDLT